MNEPAKATAKTGYIVLRETSTTHNDDSRTGWREIATINATNAQSAIREAVSGLPERPDGAYVAVPVRSWRPLSVKAEQTVSLKLEAAT